VRITAFRNQKERKQGSRAQILGRWTAVVGETDRKLSEKNNPRFYIGQKYYFIWNAFFYVFSLSGSLFIRGCGVHPN
jgi:hypothetical protein